MLMVLNQPICKLGYHIWYRDMLNTFGRFPTKREVDRRNHACLSLIDSKPYDYYSVDVPGLDEFGQLPKGERLTALLDRMMSPSRLILKVCSPKPSRILTCI